MDNEIRHQFLLDDEKLRSQDRPIIQENSDLLGRGPFVDRLVKSLIKVEGSTVRATGFVVGLTGAWGSGKSSILNLLALKLGQTDRVVVVKFNPWLFNGRDQLLVAFFNEMKNALGRNAADDIKQLSKFLDQYQRSIDVTASTGALVADAMGAGGAASASNRLMSILWRSRKSDPQDLNSIERERTQFQRKIRRANSAIVVLIDELDRVENEEVRAVAQLVKALGDIDGISYLVAYDPDRVADALGHGIGEARKNSGRAYLEKIIQHPVPLRPLFPEDIEKLLEENLKLFSLSRPKIDSEQNRCILKFLVQTIRTPREVKRLIASFEVIGSMTQDEVEPMHVLAYCWILIKFPHIQQQLQNRLDTLVEDPSEHELLRRIELDRNQDEMITSKDILGEHSAPLEPLLKSLFTRFEKGEESANPMRISLRRNLVKILYLGIPPGAPSKGEVLSFWNSDLDTQIAELKIKQNEEKLRDFISLVIEYLPQLETSQNTKFWLSLSRCLRRESPWQYGPEIQQSIVRDIEASWIRLAGLTPSLRDTFVEALEALIKDDDFIIAPGILRKDMFEHGLIKSSGKRDGPSVLNQQQTIGILDAEVPRYRQKLLSGDLLRWIPQAEPMYVLLNSDNWDDELRDSLTRQLNSKEALVTFAGILVPPNHSVGLETFKEMINVEIVLEAIDNIGKIEEPWGQTVIGRLKHALQGNNLLWFDQYEE